MRLSISSLAGTARTLVAVGTARLASMLVTVRAAAPRRMAGSTFACSTGTGAAAGTTGAAAGGTAGRRGWGGWGGDGRHRRDQDLLERLRRLVGRDLGVGRELGRLDLGAVRRAGRGGRGDRPRRRARSGRSPRRSPTTTGPRSSGR